MKKIFLKNKVVTCARFLTIWKWILRYIMTFICRPANVDIRYRHWFFFLKKAKRNLMSTLDIREVVDGISEAHSMIVYFYIWNLTWINIWRIVKTTKYCESSSGICYLLLSLFYWGFMGPCIVLRWFCMRIWIFSVLTISYLL